MNDVLGLIADSAQLLADKKRVGCPTPDYEESFLRISTPGEGSLLSLWQTCGASQNEEASLDPHGAKAIRMSALSPQNKPQREP